MKLKARAIDRRFVPNVKGIDLMHSLNYIQLEEVTRSFIYNSYTSKKVFYQKGTHSELEKVVFALIKNTSTEKSQCDKLATFVAQEVPWAGYYRRDYKKPLPSDRGLNELAVLKSGYGWCNEQARLLCYMTQIAGFSSRLVFASNKVHRYGHVITEVLLSSGWLAIDQSFGKCFWYKSKPCSAFDLWHQKPVRSYYQPRYKTWCNAMIRELGKEELIGSFNMGLSKNPLDGFSTLGYCNHFLV